MIVGRRCKVNFTSSPIASCWRLSCCATTSTTKTDTQRQKRTYTLLPDATCTQHGEKKFTIITLSLRGRRIFCGPPVRVILRISGGVFSVVGGKSMDWRARSEAPSPILHALSEEGKKQPTRRKRILVPRHVSPRRHNTTKRRAASKNRVQR